MRVEINLDDMKLWYIDASRVCFMTDNDSSITFGHCDLVSVIQRLREMATEIENQARRETLGELAAQAQELKMGYEK